MNAIVIFAFLCQLAWSVPLNPMYPEMDSGHFEGDMVLTPQQRNGIIGEFFRWPGGVVPYEIPPVYNEREKNMILRAIGMYHQFTCVRWVPKQPSDKAYVVFSKADPGCFSAVGHLGIRQEVNLGEGCFGQPGTAAHEMMHALGFFHEHSRTDRDKFVEIHLENARNGSHGNFDKLTVDQVTDFGLPYDYNSVMHYHRTAFSVNGRDTITPLDPNAQIGQREGLSSLDTAKINAMYKCT